MIGFSWATCSSCPPIPDTHQREEEFVCSSCPEGGLDALDKSILFHIAGYCLHVLRLNKHAPIVLMRLPSQTRYQQSAASLSWRSYTRGVWYVLGVMSLTWWCCGSVASKCWNQAFCIPPIPELYSWRIFRNVAMLMWSFQHATIYLKNCKRRSQKWD